MQNASSKPADVSARPQADGADYTIRIATGLVELAPDRIISTTVYNGQFPGPLLRFKEGKPVIDRHSQRHGHAGAIALARADRSRPTWMAPRRKARRSFRRTATAASRSRQGRRVFASTTRTCAGGCRSDDGTVQRASRPGVHRTRKSTPGDYDREVFLVLKEFESAFSRGGDMADELSAPANEG